MKDIGIYVFCIIIIYYIGLFKYKDKINKIKEIDTKFCELIEKNAILISIVTITGLALLVRYIGKDNISSDYIYFLEPWYKTLQENGGWRGLSTNVGDYTEGYMLFLAILTYIPIKPLYGIKIFSIVFDFIIAITSAIIVLEVLKEHKNKKLYATMIYGIQLFLPTMIVNSAYWGQCDAIYTAFILITLLMFIKEKYRMAFILVGCALSFKLHTMLFMPLLILIYIRKKAFSVIEFLNIPIAYMMISIPALLAGKPIGDIIKILVSYGDGATSMLTSCFNNFYTLILTGNEQILNYIRQLGILLTITLVGISMLVFINKKIEIDSENIIGLALFYIILITYFLPGMHERYLFPGDILSVVYFMIKRDKSKWYIPLSINMFSNISYLRYITGVFEEHVEGFLWFNGSIAVIYLFGLVYMLIDIYKDIIKSTDNRI